MNRPETTVAVRQVQCVECRRPWLAETERWRIKLLEGHPSEAVPYCPQCHDREFGEA